VLLSAADHLPLAAARATKFFQLDLSVSRAGDEVRQARSQKPSQKPKPEARARSQKQKPKVKHHGPGLESPGLGVCYRCRARRSMFTSTSVLNAHSTLRAGCGTQHTAPCADAPAARPRNAGPAPSTLTTPMQEWGHNIGDDTS
jgi:hypothetical protein